MRYAALILILAAAGCGEDDAVKPYTLDTCIVQDEKLGSMGEPYVIEYEGQQIKFCCKACEDEFRKDPAKYLKKLK